MENLFYQRPSTLPAACTQVSDVSAPLAAVTAHVLAVGKLAVQGEPIVGTSQIQTRWTQLKGRSVRAYGATGFAVKGNPMVKAIDVASGVPPRGRPV